jgi:hypothetical protein
MQKELRDLGEATPQELFARFHQDFDSDETVVVTNNEDGFFRRWRHSVLFSRLVTLANGFKEEDSGRGSNIVGQEPGPLDVKSMKNFLKRNERFINCNDIDQLSIWDFLAASDVLAVLQRDLKEGEDSNASAREWKLLFFTYIGPFLLNSAVSLIFCFLFPIIYFNTLSVPMLIFWIEYLICFFATLPFVLPFSKELLFDKIFRAIHVENIEKNIKHLYSVADSYFSLPLSSAGKFIFNQDQKQKSKSATAAKPVSIPIDAVEKHILPFLTPMMMKLHGMRKEDFEKCQEDFC